MRCQGHDRADLFSLSREKGLNDDAWRGLFGGSLGKTIYTVGERTTSEVT